MRNPKQKWPWASIVCAALFAAALAAGCSKSAGTNDETAKQEALPATVTVTQVVRADVSRILQLTGSVAAPPNRDVKVSALVAGRIADLNVAEGDRVESGQLIARIDDQLIKDQENQARYAKVQALAVSMNAKMNQDRDEELFQKGIVSKKELEDARMEYRVAEATERQADASLSLVLLQLGRTEIRSPISGTVVKRFVSLGEQVDGTAATPIVEVASLGEVELMANVPAADLRRLPVGTAVQLTSSALTGRHFTGHVVAVSQAVDPTTNAGLVRVRIPNANSELRLGMFLSAQIPIETHTKALTVPAVSIYKDQDGKPRVFKVDGENATAVEVQLGIETPDVVEILGGIKEGDKIVLTGGYGLEDKVKVKVQDAPKNGAASDPGAADKKAADKKDDK
ncbi:MAG: efflux RND transporter periplasmic adaptor subunit [Candidatus Acidiferrales bacterium]